MLKKTLTATVAVFATVAVAACGGGGDAPASGGSTPAPGVEIIDPASITDGGNITGSIAFAGEAPRAQVLQMAADPYCATSHAGSDVTAQRLVVNDNGTVRYVFVYVREGLEGKAFSAPTAALQLSQSGCMYDPHVFGIQAGQTMTIVNDDDTLHNINAQPTNNAAFNFAQPIKGMSTDVAFSSAEIVPVKCDVHPWMQAYIGVLNHPYFAVTGEDGGFAINNLPAGDYVLAAWHETEGEQTQAVTVGANETVEVTLTFGS